jgi:hypothetical protein
MTFAVNFWWDSQLSRLLKAAPHQHHYLLRQLLSATSSDAAQLLLASIQPWAPQGDHQQQQAQPLQQPEQSQQHPEQQQNHQEKQQQPDEDQAAPCNAHKRPRLDNSSVASQQQQQDAAGLGVGEGLTQFEAQALAVLTAGLGPQDEQQQQEQQQQRTTAADPKPAGVTDSEAAGGAASSSSAPCTGLLVSDSCREQQSTCQQQLLAAAVAGGAVVSQEQQQEEEQQRGVWRSAGSSGDVLGLTDPVSRVLAALQPRQLLRVLWQGSTQHPAAVGQLLLHGLSPAAAQLLTQGLEAADGLLAAADVGSNGQAAAAVNDTSNTAAPGSAARSAQQEVLEQQQEGTEVAPGAALYCSRQEFYGRLYGTVQDPAEVLQALLRAKTRLAAAATGVVLRAQLGEHMV